MQILICLSACLRGAVCGGWVMEFIAEESWPGADILTQDPRYMAAAAELIQCKPVW